MPMPVLQVSLPPELSNMVHRLLRECQTHANNPLQKRLVAKCFEITPAERPEVPDFSGDYELQALCLGAVFASAEMALGFEILDGGNGDPQSFFLECKKAAFPMIFSVIPSMWLRQVMTAWADVVNDIAAESQNPSGYLN